MQDFDDIRPYHDSEVSGTIARVIKDREFIELISRYRYPTLSKLAVGPIKWLLDKLVSRALFARFGSLQTVLQMQQMVESYMTRMIRQSTDGFSYDGLESLSSDQAYLFLSNHRDITLDPAFTNYALHLSGFSTVRIAIGDNLLTKPWASDLMRLNKSFIVRRSISKPRELLKALTKLSAYIKHSLSTDNQPVWIAHREGRAKDGIDKTDLAVLKMIFLAKPKKIEFGDYLQELNLVPISIAYEFDPCIAVKARELRLKNTEQGYEKTEHEDLESIGLGISGEKGRVHLQFNHAINIGGSFENVDVLEKYLDKEIVAAYRLFPSNLLAYKKIYSDDVYGDAMKRLTSLGYIDDATIKEASQLEYQQRFNQHMETVNTEDRDIAYQCYANPIVAKLSLNKV